MTNTQADILVIAVCVIAAVQFVGLLMGIARR